MASSGLNQSADTVSVNASDAVMSDIKSISSELKELKKTIDEINAGPVETGQVKNKSVKNKPVKSKPAKKKQVENKLVKNKPENKVTHHKGTSSTLKVERPVKKLEIIVSSPVNSNRAGPTIEKNTTVTRLMSDYIKHDEKGETLADNKESWTCVHDPATGLMWEVKSLNTALRNPNNLYSWYDPANNNVPGVPDGGRCKGEADCDTNAYIKAMNESNYCGHNDWQLPTREQMQTLVDLRKGESGVKINQQYFPNTMPSWYWTSSDKKNSESAWYVLFRNGVVLSDLKERPKHIRLVRENIDGANGG